MHQNNQHKFRSSFTGAAPANDKDRRTEARRAVPSRTLSISCEGEDHPFIVKNLSCNGASGLTAAPLEAGKAVRLTLENGHVAAARIRWVREGAAGLAFAFPLSVDMVGAQVSGRTSFKRRSPRFRTGRPASIRVGGVTRAAKVLNLSVGGAEIETAFPLAPGQVLTLECEIGPAVECQVRWSRGGRTGLMFRSEVDLDSFV